MAFAVVKSWYGTGNAPRDNGTSIIGIFENIKDAQEALKKEALSWKENDYSALYGVEKKDWKPGYVSNPEEWLKWSDCCFDEDLWEAWALDSDRDNFERVEIHNLTR